MSRNVDQIPIYAADGAPRGYRSRDAAQKLLRAGFVTAAYGRKHHLRAIFMRCEDGSNPVQPNLKVGTRYSYQQHLDSGFRCWRFKKLDQLDENGEPVSTRDVFLRVLQDCLA